jgi:replicative DNA helicase
MSKQSNIEKQAVAELKKREIPNAVEVEKELLGAMLIDEEAAPKVFEVLKPEHFFDPRHRKIFKAMYYLFENSVPINVTTVYSELEKMKDKRGETIGAAYIGELSRNVVSAVNAAYNARVILEKWILRRIIASSINMAEEAFAAQKDVFDILDEAERNIFSIAEEGLRESYVGMDKALTKTLEYIESIHDKKKSAFAVPTGLIELDDLLGGFQRSDLIIIAARPSMGKTAFALSVARNAAIDYNVPVAFFSLEMSTTQLVSRLISAEAKIDLHLIRTGKIPSSEAPRLATNVQKLRTAQFFIDDTPGQTVMEIRAKARRLKAEHKIGMIMIDYLQLMTSSKKMESREREISAISMSLKALAKELNIPVVALAQLNRAVEQRHDKRPMLSDLRESGSIEQDADVVIFLYRPEVYGITTLPDGESTEGYAEAIIGKQRNGPIGVVPLHFIKQFGRFENKALQYREIPEGDDSPKSITQGDEPPF